MKKEYYRSRSEEPENVRADHDDHQDRQDPRHVERPVHPGVVR